MSRETTEELMDYAAGLARHYDRDADFREPFVPLEAAKGCHKILDLAGRRCFAGFEVVLDA